MRLFTRFQIQLRLCREAALAAALLPIEVYTTTYSCAPIGNSCLGRAELALATCTTLLAMARQSSSSCNRNTVFVAGRAGVDACNSLMDELGLRAWPASACRASASCVRVAMESEQPCDERGRPEGNGVIFWTEAEDFMLILSNRTYRICHLFSEHPGSMAGNAKAHRYFDGKARTSINAPDREIDFHRAKIQQRQRAAHIMIPPSICPAAIQAAPATALHRALMTRGIAPSLAGDIPHMNKQSRTVRLTPVSMALCASPTPTNMPATLSLNSVADLDFAAANMFPPQPAITPSISTCSAPATDMSMLGLLLPKNNSATFTASLAGVARPSRLPQGFDQTLPSPCPQRGALNGNGMIYNSPPMHNFGITDYAAGSHSMIYNPQGGFDAYMGADGHNSHWPNPDFSFLFRLVQIYGGPLITDPQELILYKIQITLAVPPRQRLSPSLSPLVSPGLTPSLRRSQELIMLASEAQNDGDLITSPTQLEGALEYLSSLLPICSKPSHGTLAQRLHKVILPEFLAIWKEVVWLDVAARPQNAWQSDACISLEASIRRLTWIGSSCHRDTLSRGNTHRLKTSLFLSEAHSNAVELAVSVAAPNPVHESFRHLSQLEIFSGSASYVSNSISRALNFLYARAGGGVHVDSGETMNLGRFATARDFSFSVFIGNCDSVFICGGYAIVVYHLSQLQGQEKEAFGEMLHSHIPIASSALEECQTESHILLLLLRSPSFHELALTFRAQEGYFQVCVHTMIYQASASSELPPNRLVDEESRWKASIQVL
ncbi:uncharacterized protein MYCFIDRAFT_178978 [Pseudocercospora fijiensis CIRAD86]|uniref:Uncharacterized protein n=1 Tax=Pseudocercospora fijiensis (strain CIRAD86) TaxID=383855 RepID=M3AN58_PSEFD|nr:uncharacterized protein MYCFIDRAFT_178978 [Pseudocercospora fijiensis CIRAD86]EME78892.1 hypothetical protein MYCFIDRAFT_178978 [Pseudocercospora fijiensis CIRAD86]